MMGCELGGGQKISVGGSGGGAIEMIRIIVVDQLKALYLDLNNILRPTPIRWTRHFWFVLARSDKETVAAKKSIGQEDRGALSSPSPTPDDRFKQA